jgi:xylulokinase
MGSVMGGDVFIGIDSGTQSTKVLIVEGERGEVLSSAAAPHVMIQGLPPGHLEQEPQGWFEALDQALQTALHAPGVDPSTVRAIGVSGQQHGFVALDATGAVIRPAKLWCDTSTAPQCERILASLGGLGRMIALTGNGLPPGFTASKIAWLKEAEPESYAKLATVLLPHDYLNYRLTGLLKMECGDASGTGLFDVKRRTWQPEVVRAIDVDLWAKLPPLMPSDALHGTLRPELAEHWGLPKDILVSSGGGDNMMSAIGTGNVRDGVVTVSLGTSGTILAYSSTPVIDPRGEVAAFCDSTGGYLPLACTMNVTVATELTKGLLRLSNEGLEEAAATVPPGSDGLLLVPYFDGERTPNVPDGTGVWFGARRKTHTAAHFCRAAMEGATLGLNYGMRRMAAMGVKADEIRLTGGGSKSRVWRQIAADVFRAPVVCLEQDESAALGAAIQARWCWERQQGRGASITELADAWARPVAETRVDPIPTAARVYGELYALQTALSAAMRPSFVAHRQLLAALNGEGR